ncbi:MAG: CRTAC1 family protein [Planctomycetota bacterium]
MPKKLSRYFCVQTDRKNKAVDSMLQMSEDSPWARVRIIKTLQMTGCLFLAAVVLVSCRSKTPGPARPWWALLKDTKAAVPDTLSEGLAEFNRGAALLEQYKYGEAAKAFERVLDTAPDWTAARFNLGLAYFNLQVKPGAKSYLKLSKEAFETVLQSDPNHLHSRFCLGLYYQYVGENEKALECFRAVYENDDQDPYVVYKYAEALISVGRADEGTRMLEKVIALDPGFISAVYRLAAQYQRMRLRDKAMPLFARFRKLKEAELAAGVFTVLKMYGSAGKYYMALGADNLPLPTTETSAPRRILFSPEPKVLTAEVSAWECTGGTVALPGIAAGDIDGDGDIDLCITSFGTDGSVRLWRNNGAGEFSADISIAQQGISPCFGDVDNDGDLDLWLGRAGPDLYFENDGTGNFKEIEVSPMAGTELVTHCARLLDADSDGDLDFLSFRFTQGSVPVSGTMVPATSSVYNNNRDGSFPDIAEELGLGFAETAVAAAVYDDFDNDRDLDFVIFPAGDAQAIGWVNDRAWEYHTLDAETTGLSITNVLSATSGDPDKDGDRDLLVSAEEGLYLFVNQGAFGFKLHRSFADSCGRFGGTGGQFADMDNDGDLDILIADAFRSDGSRGPMLLVNDWPRDRFINVLELDPGNLLAAITTKADTSCLVTDFTGNGRCDVLLAPVGERPFLLENITGNDHWIELDLLGSSEQDKTSRSNNSAIGARVEFKAGNISQQYVVGVPSGPVTMPAHRIHAGLGGYSKVDWLRIVWPDGVLQAELELAADQVITVTELQRKTSSCPHLFAWDGSHFEFISDFGGMGGLGYLVAPGEYAKPDSTEYLPVRNLKPRDGEYVLQVLEPLEEVVYFDEAKLIAVDHPEGTEVYPREMMAINAPAPAFELFCFRDPIEAVRAIDHRGEDVTEAIRTVDRKYAGVTELDRRFTGFAKNHSVELDFGNRLKKVSPESRLVLFLYGWVEYSYSSTNFAASQAGMSIEAPSIEVFRDGAWVELFHEVGYPAGIRHMMTLEVTGKVLVSDRRIRISTNMELFWDRIFIASVLEDAVVNVKEVPVKNADLHFLGFPREYSPDGHHPNLYDYGNVDRAVAWKIMSGSFTRFGEVTELLDEADDCYVIMGRGEELTLRFSAGSFDLAPPGYCRSFILKTDSFCKDMDLYSAHPDTVEPLPFHNMSNYPYKANEHYPDDGKRRSYQRRFNTRQVGGTGN